MLPCIEKVVANDLKPIAMELIGPGSRVVRHDALSQPVLRRKRRTQDVELVHKLKRRIPDRLETLRLRLRHRNAVEHDFTLKSTPPLMRLLNVLPVTPGARKTN